MKNEKIYIEKLVLDEDYTDTLVLEANKKISKFKRNNPKKPKSKHHQNAELFESELD